MTDLARLIEKRLRGLHLNACAGWAIAAIILSRPAWIHPGAVWICAAMASIQAAAVIACPMSDELRAALKARAALD